MKSPTPAVDLLLASGMYGANHRKLPKHAFFSMVAQALREGSKGFPIFRPFRIALREKLDTFLEELAMSAIGTGLRVDETAAFIVGNGLFVNIDGATRDGFCSCSFELWAETTELAKQARQSIILLAGDRQIDESEFPWFSLNWNFTLHTGEIIGVTTEEKVTESLEDEAYPVLEDGIEQFIQSYLSAPESVLVLQGPPGTGKTKLIRTLLGSISHRKGENARVIYTGDEAVLKKDEIFVKFLSGGYDAFLIEDADLLLKPRTDGNNLMHRFLNVADGIATSNKRKIIFSTNLANIRDIDSALTRPGRCFAHVALRKLSAVEASRLARRLCGNDPGLLAAVLDNLAAKRESSHSVAEIYSAYRATMQPCTRGLPAPADSPEASAQPA